MSKALIAITLSASVTVGGAAYYIGPGTKDQLDTPPVLVNGAPEDAIQRISAVNIAQLASMVGARQDDAEAAIHMEHAVEGNSDTITFSFLHDPVLKLHVVASSVDSTTSQVDITPEILDSRFAKRPELMAYDLKIMAGFADYLASDVTNAVLNAQRLANNSEREKFIKTRVSFDEEQWRNFGIRTEAAFAGAYERDMESLRYGYHRSSGYWGSPEWGGGGVATSTAAWGESESAASAAQDAATAASGAAAAAAAAAQAAAR